MKTLAAALATSLAMVSLGVPIAVSAQDSTVDMTTKPQKTAAISRRLTADVRPVGPAEVAEKAAQFTYSRRDGQACLRAKVSSAARWRQRRERKRPARTSIGI